MERRVKKFAIGYARTRVKREQSTHLRLQERVIRDYAKDDGSEILRIVSERYYDSYGERVNLPKLDEAFALALSEASENKLVIFYFIRFGRCRQNHVVMRKIHDFKIKNKDKNIQFHDIEPDRISHLLNGKKIAKPAILSDQAQDFIRHWQKSCKIRPQRIKNLEYYFCTLQQDSPIHLGKLLLDLKNGENSDLTDQQVADELNAMGLSPFASPTWEKEDVKNARKLWSSEQFQNYKNVRNAYKKLRYGEMSHSEILAYVENIPKGSDQSPPTDKPSTV